MNATDIAKVNSYCKYNETHSIVEGSVQMAALSLVGVLGVLGNVFTIVLAAKFTVRRNLHFLIINMAVSDTLVILMHILDALIIILKQKLPDNMAGVFFCKMVLTVNAISHIVSLITLVIISFERFCITRRQVVQMPRQYSVKQRLSLLACSWVIPTLMSLYEVTSNVSIKDGQCDPTSHLDGSDRIWILTRVTLKIAFFLLLLVLSVVTLRRLSTPQAIEGNLSEVQRKRRRRRIGAAVRMVLYSLLLFSSCYLPFYITQLVHYTLLFVSSSNAAFNSESLVFIIGYFLPVVNSSLSRCVYFFCLSDFRQAARAVLRRGNVNGTNNSAPIEASIKDKNRCAHVGDVRMSNMVEPHPAVTTSM